METQNENVLAALADVIARPDPAARGAARKLLAVLDPDGGSFGRIADAAVWLAGVRGCCPPPAPARPRLLCVGRDPASAGRVGGLTGLPESRCRSLAIEPAPAGEAVQAGRALANAEADAGTDLLVLAAPAPGRETRVATATLTAACTGADAPSVVATAAGADADWMRDVAGVRDRLRSVRAAHPDPVAMLSAAGDPEPAFLAGLLAGSAARHTPVVIEGVVALAAALVANLASGAAPEWLLLAHDDPDPAARLAARHLGLDPFVDIGARPGAGIAGALTIPLLVAAAALLDG